MTPEERQEYFDQYGYWPTTYAPRNGNAATSGAESTFGPFFGRETRNRFHRPNCKYICRFLKCPDTIRFESHAEAAEAGRKPCMTCRA